MSAKESDKDDLFAYQKPTHSLYVYKNDATATPHGTAGHFTLGQGFQAPLQRPRCTPTAAGTCSGYNTGDWSSVSQMVAPGPLSLAAYNAANPGQQQSLAPDLITVENGKLWYYTSGANPNTYFDSAYQIGTGDWSTTTVVGVGNVGAVVAGTKTGATSTGGTPTLWVRDNTTGAVSSFPLTFDANGYPTTNIAAPTRAPLVSGVTDSAGKNMCLDIRNADTANGTAAQVASCNSSDAQSFTLGRDSTVHALGKCLDIDHSSTANGAAVQLWDCNNSATQQWVPGPFAGTLLNPNSGRCLTDPAASNTPGTQIVISDCLTGHPEQNWAATTTNSALPAAQSVLPLGINAKAYPALSTPGDTDGDGNPELYAIAADGRITAFPGAGLPTGPLVDRWKLTDTTDAVRTNNLTLNGGATVAPDTTQGQALSLNGTTAYASSAATSVNTSQSFTVSAWVNLSAIPAQNVTAVSQDGTQNSGFYLQYNAGLGKWCLSFMANDTATSTGSSFSPCSNTNVAPNTWIHLAGTYDATAKTGKLYVNGNLAATTTGLISDVQVRTGTPAAVAQFGTPNTLGYVHLQPGDEWKLTDAKDSVRTNGLTVSGGSFTADPAGQHGTVLNLPGTAGTGAQTTGSVLDTSRSYTVSAWVYLKSTAGYATAVAQSATNTSAFYLQCSKTFNAWTFIAPTTDTASPAGGAAAYAPTPPALNTWTHLVGTYDATTQTMSLYVNGALTATATNTSPLPTTGPLTIGMAKTGDNFPGLISDVQTWSGALTASTISTLDNTTKPTVLQLS